MKIVLIVFISLLFAERIHAQSTLIQETQFGENPGNLAMKYYLPTGQNDTLSKKPLVVALHGCSQSSNSLAVSTGWNKLADENNFIVLYPSQKRSNNVSKCFNWFEMKDISKNSGELQSIMNMIDYTIRSYDIDTSRIYIYGLSAGAAMGVALMAVYPEYFQAGAIFAGAPYKAATSKRQALTAMLKVQDKSPKDWGELVSYDAKISYPKLVVCHGSKDKVVNIKNSLELIDQWTYLHQIDTIPDTIIVGYKAPAVVRSSYTRSTSEEVIVFYKFLDIGHVIPIDPGSCCSKGGVKGTYTKDIDFFSTYYVAKEFRLIIE